VTVVIPGEIPQAPSELRIDKVQKKNIKIVWLDNSTNEAGFYVQRAPDVGGAPGTWVDIATLPIDTTSYVDNGLTSKTTYWYRVAAWNSVGTSAWTAEVSGTTK
jgi:hypothetical protein